MENELTEKEKWALYQCDDGLGRKEFIINGKLKILGKEAEKILKKLYELKLIDFDPYKDKDLGKYLGLKTKKEKEDFKKNNPPSFFVTETGKGHLDSDPSWD